MKNKKLIFWIVGGVLLILVASYIRNYIYLDINQKGSNSVLADGSGPFGNAESENTGGSKPSNSQKRIAMAPTFVNDKVAR